MDTENDLTLAGTESDEGREKHSLTGNSTLTCFMPSSTFTLEQTDGGTDEMLAIAVALAQHWDEVEALEDEPFDAWMDAEMDRGADHPWIRREGDEVHGHEEQARNHWRQLGRPGYTPRVNPAWQAAVDEEAAWVADIAAYNAACESREAFGHDTGDFYDIEDWREEGRPGPEAFAQAAVGDPAVVATPTPRDIADKVLAWLYPNNKIRWWRGEYWRYNGLHWEAIDEKRLEAIVGDYAATLYYFDAKGNTQLLRHKLKGTLLRDIVGQMRRTSNMLDDQKDAPFWVDNRRDAADYISVRDGLLRLRDRVVIDHTRRYFCTSHLPVYYNPRQWPYEWLAFLDQVLPNQEARDILQEWFGYCLTRDTSRHKILAIVGERRSGKGTIAHVLQALLGPESTAAPTLDGLAHNFGMEDLIGKRLAVFGDERLSGRADAVAITGRLVSLTGGDVQQIPRKYRSAWIGKLDAKFMLLSNEVPRLPDASGAMASRFILLRTVQSFYGREDFGLLDRLMAELPGILNWALDGLERLTAQKRFTEATDAHETLEELEDIGSPVMAFIRERCEVGTGFVVPTARLYDAFVQWCTQQGIKHVPTQPVFGRDLKAACPATDVKRFKSGDRREQNYTGLRLV